jgi:hypothetical protein
MGGAPMFSVLFKKMDLHDLEEIVENAIQVLKVD